MNTIERSRATQKLLMTARAIGMNNLNAGGVAKMQAYFMDQIRQALAEGADLLARDRQDKDAMDWLAYQDKGATAVCVAAAKLLIDEGYPLLDRPSLHTLERQLREKITEHMARKERDGVIIRSANGQHFLHTIAEYPRDVLEACVSACAILKWGKTPPPHRWVGEADNEGRTPLHVMWQARVEPFEDEDQHWAWDVSMMLESYGADLMARDKNGDSVLDLMERMMQMGHVDIDGPNIEASSMAYVADIRARLMERVAPAASIDGRRPRL